MDWALYTDLYQLTMAQGYLMSSAEDEEATFNVYFRDYPFKGGYAIACGMAQIAEILEGYSFKPSDVEYLKSLTAPGGGPLFHEDFLSYLASFKLEVTVDAVHEGTVVFPNEPMVRVQGPIMQCQMLETMLLNCVGFQTLVATKAARVCQAADGRPVTEFGLRRAQGTGGLWASRAAVVGGCASTSNVLAGKEFGLPVSGTHSHSWVMSFPDELTAFREYARISPENCSLLVDTYDVEQGIANAITVGLEMKERGEKLRAIRIDSGDLAWLAKMARRKLDEAGLTDVQIMLTNDLDEALIQSILDEGAPVDIWGVGTKLSTAYDQPTLGAVYKLSATRAEGDATWTDKLKISESATKLTTPGVLDVRRYYNEDGKLAGDMVFDIHDDLDDESQTIVDPMDSLRQKQLAGKSYETLMVPLFANGKSALTKEQTDPLAARERSRHGLATLDESQLRLLNPHTYPVGLERHLHDRRQKLIAHLRRVDCDL